MTNREEWEKENPLRRWLISQGRGGLLQVSLDTGILYERLAYLEQGLGVPNRDELKKLSELLGDPDLEAKWEEWRRSEPRDHPPVIPR